MRKIAILLCTAAAVACTQNSQKVKTVTAEKAVAATENPYKGLKFDNKKDFYCNMDIEKYGAGDTLHYKGKLYGFCSKTCKDEFRKDPEGYLSKAGHQ